MIRGCHARAILSPVVRKFFARFLASRRLPVAGSSRRYIFFLFRCHKLKRKFSAVRLQHVSCAFIS